MMTLHSEWGVPPKQPPAESIGTIAEVALKKTCEQSGKTGAKIIEHAIGLYGNETRFMPTDKEGVIEVISVGDNELPFSAVKALAVGRSQLFMDTTEGYITTL